MRHRPRFHFLIRVSLLLVLSATACGPAADEDGRMKIAGMFMQEDQFFRLVRFGMQEAAREEGIELLLSTVDGKPEKELQLVNTYIARQVDAIVLSPLSATASVTALRRASEAGIHVIAYNSTVEGGLTATFIESDQSNLGAQTGKVARAYIEEKLGGQAQIAILAFKSALTEQSEARTNGFKSQIADLSGVEIVAEQDAWLPEMGIRKAGDILTANPGVDLIWCANEGGTVGAVMAVKSAGRGGEVAVFGTDVSDQMLGFLLSEDQILQAVTGQKPFEIGYQSVKAAVAVIQGREVESHVSMSGVLLERRDLENVRAYRARLQELIASPRTQP